MSAWPSALSIGGGATGRIDGGVRVLELPPPLDGKGVRDKHAVRAYLDLLHWMLDDPMSQDGRLELPAGVPRSSLDAIASLECARKPGLKIEVAVGAQAVALTEADFSAVGAERAKQLKLREASATPKIVKHLCDAVSDPRFTAYRNLNRAQWFGKIEGLRLCEFEPDGKGGVLKVSTGLRTDSPKTVYVGFRAAVGTDELPFTLDPGPTDHGVGAAAAAIKKLIESRAQGSLATTYQEGRLEAGILRGTVSIAIDGVGSLTVASPWGQFPTLWSPAGQVKELDVLMRQGPTPWAVELKHHQPAGIVSYYRQAVGQAALYRTFIRKALLLHPWFAGKGMDGARCEAAIVLTENRTHPQWDLRLGHVERLASLFDVYVSVIVPVDGIVDVAMQVDVRRAK